MSQNLPAVAVTMNEIERMAEAFAKSGMFGAKSKEQALALLLLAHGEGLHPAIAMRDFDVIQGRPAKKAEAMLRSFISNGGKVEWHKLDDDCADATFSHPQGGSARITWDMARVRKAQISNQAMYNKYPRQMLRSRCVSEGCRTVFPASTSGLYVPEEAMDIAREKDITPTAGYLADLTADRQTVMHETATEVKALWANDQAADGYALIENSGFSAEEMIALWSLLPSNIRSAHKRMKAEETAGEKGVISPAKHKRLEALIKEQKLDRAALKSWCKEQFGVDSFPKLDDAQYKLLDDYIASGATTNAAAQSSTATDYPAPSQKGVVQGEIDAAATINEAQESAIIDLCELHGVSLDRFLVRAKITHIAKLQASQFEGAVKWLKSQTAKEK